MAEFCLRTILEGMTLMTVNIAPNTSGKQQGTTFNARAAWFIVSPFACVRFWQTRRAIALLSRAPDLMLKDLGIVRSDIERVVRLGRR